MTATTGNRRMSRAEAIERSRGIAVVVAPQVEQAEKLRYTFDRSAGYRVSSSTGSHARFPAVGQVDGMPS